MSVIGFERKITWDDFTEVESIPVGFDLDANTSAKIYCHYTATETRKGYVVMERTFEVSMDITQSWVLVGKKCPQLLQHEQGHYDIAALATREIYLKTPYLNAKELLAFHELFKRMKSLVEKRSKKAQLLYDSLTQHANNELQQGRWNKAFAREKNKRNGSVFNLPF